MTAPLRKEFDEFLFASVGDDANGFPLTVLSALARLDVDPWEEAANLARLSRESATQRLAVQLAALPNGSAPRADSATIATRLIALLHRSPGPRVFSPAAPPRELATPSRRIDPKIYYLVAVLVLLACEWAQAISHPKTPANSNFAPAALQDLLPESR